MCGRYYLASDLEELIRRYGLLETEIDYSPRLEIFPSEEIPVIISSGEGNKELKMMKWGFTPAFTKRLIINARGETIDSKPTFRKAFQQRRCLIPASGFFEWKKEAGKSIKHKIYLADDSIFSLAGIYDTFTDRKGDTVRAVAIITTAPNQLLGEIHNRMPVILAEDKEEAWLDRTNQDLDYLKDLLKPHPEAGMLLNPC